MLVKLCRIFVAVGVFWIFGAGASAEVLPSKLSDEEFWNIVRDFSESSGSFPSDNFVSNERSFQKILPDLKRRATGGAYVGVGPEQNFTYVSTLRPEIAFIIDIRRQNMIEHLVYKALFEISADRVEFLSRLFSRPLPSGTDRNSSIVALLASIRRIPADHVMYEANLDAIRKQLIDKHGFDLLEWDKTNLEDVYRAFYAGGPELRYDGLPTDTNNRLMPTFGELLSESNPDGTNDNFLANEENFRAVQKLEKNNLIIPLVGDFSGSSAISAVGDYLRK